MAASLEMGTPLAQALSDVIQPKLVEVGWSTGGAGDSALAEYIMLMLSSGKTQEQIASELSNDLLNLGPEDSGANEFARWLFEQVQVLDQQLNGTSSHVGAEPHMESRLAGGQEQAGVPAAEAVQDADMGEATAVTGEREIPTGPKSMRNGGRNGNNRMMGQISKAMDRSADSQLHRVRAQQGIGRINTHREPPKGPRNQQNRNQRMPNGRPIGSTPGGAAGGAAQAMLSMSPQQQMQLLAMYEEQARMMSQILSPQQQQQMFLPPGGPAINPAFGNGFPGQQQSGRSLFDRVQGQSRPPYQNGRQRKNQEAVAQENTGETPSSSMEVESSQPKSDEETVCKFNLSCTRSDCPYAHQSPAAPPGTTIDTLDVCTFGAACKNRKCVGRHPSPAQKSTHQAEQDCKFFPNCTNPNCPFKHPSMPLCRNGADCSTPGCKFTHLKTVCRFNPCLNPSCPYKHEEGQKRGSFADKVWTADGASEKTHVSERKFVDEEKEEELILPDNDTAGETQASAAEIAT